ncbi:rho-related GTP-binding protein RhoF-like [Carcharodon carcharias]|uniref:rho-related GTP-binding protein RhoF-like n=1 Tax=Carcharodon carcharias TaxID=13397 RepID=UPI001B7E0223|nr:rho-related GTP-binding protein RhoF-like [Carcharodon carcharias]
MPGGCFVKALKMVVVGDGGCGKTSLQTVFTEGHFSEIYVPTVSEIFSAQFNCGSLLLEINMWDTAGKQDYDRLRPLCYQGANVVLICYDVSNPASFHHVLTRWLPELRQFCPGTPMFLVACKKDLRMDKICQRQLNKAGQQIITSTQGLTMADQICAAGFLECSAKLEEKVVETFHDAVLAAFTGCSRTRVKRKSERSCLVS